MNAASYVDPRFFDNDPESFGDIWNAVGQIGSTGLALGVGMLQGGGQGGGGSQANQCSVHPVECLDQMIREYQGMMAAARTIAEQIQIVQAFLTLLNDASVIRQDAGPYLDNTKSQLQQKLNTLRGQTTNPATPATPSSGTLPTPGTTLPATGQTMQPVVNPATGQVVMVPVQNTTGGISTTTLLMIAALGIGAIVLLKD